MADIIDDADKTCALLNGGARFVRAPALERGRPSDCRCGGAPKFKTVTGGKTTQEILECPLCRRSTSPRGSRQQLTIEWNRM